MTKLPDGRVEVTCLDERRVTLTPGGGHDVAETDQPGVVRIEKKRGWGYMVHGEYAEIRDALARPEAA